MLQDKARLSFWFDRSERSKNSRKSVSYNDHKGKSAQPGPPIPTIKPIVWSGQSTRFLFLLQDHLQPSSSPFCRVSPRHPGSPPVLFSWVKSSEGSIAVFQKVLQLSTPSIQPTLREQARWPFPSVWLSGLLPEEPFASVPRLFPDFRLKIDGPFPSPVPNGLCHS